MQPRHTDEIKFCCPKCGGHCFGSGDNGDGTRTYNCQERRHGSLCKFTIHGRDLWTVMARVVTTVTPFASDAEYRATFSGEKARIARAITPEQKT